MKKLMIKEIESCYQCIHKTVAFTCDLIGPEKEIPIDGVIPNWCPLSDAPPNNSLNSDSQGPQPSRSG